MKKTVRPLVIIGLCVAMILCVASCEKKPTDEPNKSCTHVAAAAVRENVKQPGCTTEGSYDEVVYCKSCGEELSRQKKSINATGHSLGEFASDNNATCTEDGTKTKKCLNQGCDYKETVREEGSAKGHIASDMQFSGEYCNGNPLAKIYCGVCSTYMGEYGHKYEKSITPPTCTDEGQTVYTCSECSHSYSEPIRSQGHVTSAWETSAEPTCSTEGTLIKKCLVCDSVVDTKSIKKLEHTYVGSLSGSNMYYSCTECGDSYTEAVKTPVYTITFEENGASQIEDVSILEYDVPTLPIPERDGYIFVGWYSDAAMSELYTEASVTSDITLYAKWEEPVTVTDDEDIIKNAPLDYTFKVTSSVKLDNSNVNDYVKITTLAGETLTATVSYSDGEYEISCAYAQGKSYLVSLESEVSFVGKENKSLLIFTEGESENVIKLKDGVLSFSYDELFGAYETEEGLLLITYKDILDESRTAVFYEDNENAYRLGVRVKMEGKLGSYSTYLVETLTVEELFEECDISHSENLNFDNAEINDNLSEELESAFLESEIYFQYVQAARTISRKYGGDLSDPVFKAQFYTEGDNFVIKLSVTAKMSSGIAFIMDYYINLAFDVDFKLNGEKSTLLLLTDMTNTVYLNVEINGEAMHGASTTARQTLLNEYRRVFNEISERNMKLDPADANKENKTKKIDIATIPMKTGLVTVDLHITAEFEFGMMGGLSAKLVHRVESEIGMINGKFVSDYEAKLVSISGYAYSGAEIYGGIGVSLDVSFCGLTGYVKGRVGLRGEILGSAVISINERSSYVLGTYYFDSEVVMDMSVGVKYRIKVLSFEKTLLDKSMLIAEVGIPFITLGDEIIYLHFTDDSYASSSESLDIGSVNCGSEINISNKVNSSILSIDADSLVSKFVNLPCSYTVESINGNVVVRAYGNGKLKIFGNGSFTVQLKVKYSDILEKTVYVKGTVSNHSYSDSFTCHDRTCSNCDYVLAATTDHNLKDNVCECGFVDPNATLSPNISFTLVNGSYTITGYTGNATEIIIPSEHEGVPIVAIADYAFQNRTSITKVVISDNVKLIGARAFYNCKGLTSVTIGKSVTSIGESAFYGCTSLTSITIPDSVTSIGAHAFYNCKGLTSVTIGKSVTNIGVAAFCWCTALTEINFNAISMKDLNSNNDVLYNAGIYASGITVNIGANVIKMPKYLFSLDNSSLVIIKVVFAENSVCRSIECAFSGCTGLTSITIPDSVTSIGNYTFQNCTSLTSITIPDSVTSIGDFAFSNCDSLTSVTIPDGVTSIGMFAFSGCTGLTSIIIPDSVTSIGGSAFEYCTGLTSVTIGKGVTNIGESAFDGCTSLNSIIIPNGVTSIGNSAFQGCTSLTSITIPDSVTSIANRVFMDCTSLASITIPDSVTSIGFYAFTGCTGLTEINFNATAMNDLDSGNKVFYNAGKNASGITVNIGSNVTGIPAYLFNPYSSQNYSPKIVEVIFAENSVCTYIGYYAFYNCTSLTSITIPDSVTSIGGSAFSGCTGLTSIAIPESVTSIGSVAFWGCTGLTSATIGNGVTNIGLGAFSGCTSLVSVTIGNSVTSIGDEAFFDCARLTSITIPDSVTSIGDWAFYGCTGLKAVYITDIAKWYAIYFADSYSNPLRYAHNLYLNGELVTEVVIPDGVTSIGSYAFRGCTGLTSVTIPDSVTNIGSSAFNGCTGLTGITIPKSVTSIGTDAFSGCTGLTSITIPDSVTSIGYGAFSGCTGLTSVTIGKGVTSIDNYAFYECTSLTDVYYTGTEEQWKAISKGNYNTPLTNATIHYNYVPKE